MQTIYVVLFDDFETLDVFGPVEILGHFEEHLQLKFVSLHGGLIKSSQKVEVMTEKFSNEVKENHILFVPGGQGTRREISNEAFLNMLVTLSKNANYVLSVCTGSALLAKAGLLSEKRATSNKRSFEWVMAQSDSVKWERKARWVKEGNYFTSSGVSAGIDMTLGFISHLLGLEAANQIAKRIEYLWNSNSEEDPFSVE